MPRLIDADAFDKVLKEAQIKCKRNGGNFRYGVLNNVRANLEKAPTVNGWISVKDRLPEVDKVVLAYGTRSATTGMFQGVGTRNDLWWWKGHTIKHVSHWMPLPEGPKERDDDAGS